MKVYGLTGGIGAGKSVVSRIFRLLEVPVYDADKEAKRLTNTNPAILDGAISIFGPEASLEGTLNRAFIAKEAFAHPKKLDQLNQIIHPLVGQDYREWLRKQDSAYLIREAAILFETGGQEGLAGTILVSAPESIRIQRVLKRDPHRDSAQVKQIIERQWPEEKKRKLANYFIENDPNKMLLPQVLNLHHQFLSI